MPVTSLKANLNAQAGKVPANVGKVNFSPAFENPPVLVLTAELKLGGTEPVKVSITSINISQATFSLEPANMAQTVHWIASEPTS